MVLTYIPWIFILFKQLKKVRSGYWIPPVNLEYLIQSFVYYVTINTNTIISILSLLFLVIIFIVFYLQYNEKDSLEYRYILVGLSIFILTIILAVIISFIFKPILQVRYLLPSVAVLWISISILVGKIENNVLLVFLLSFILIFGAFGICDTAFTCQSFYETGIQNQNSLDSMDNTNSTVICIGPGIVIQFGTYFNKSNVYMHSNSAYGIPEKDLGKLFNIKYDSDVENIIENNKGNDIYILMGDWNKLDTVTENDSFYEIDRNIF